MSNKSVDFRDRWWERVLNDRRQYFFQKIWNRKSDEKKTLWQFFGWIWSDLTYSKKWGLNILLQLRAYGTLLRKCCGISLWHQFSRMIYLAFIQQVDPNSLRGRRLYLSESWKYVDDYTYEHDKSQYLLAEKTFPEEIELFEDKFKFYEFCRAHNLKTPNILAVFVDGKVVWPENSSPVIPEQNLFIKSLRGKAGQGIKKMLWRGEFFIDKHGKKFTSDELFDLLAVESQKTGIVLQEVIQNHSSWTGFTSGALATCRIVTAKSPVDGSVIPLFTSLRMPVGDAEFDNFSQGGFYSGIDLVNGKLGVAMGMKPVNGSFDFTIHPDTGQKIEGTLLPFWVDVLEFTLLVHSKFKTLFMGWDISMTEQGPMVIEGNIGWASRSYECPNMSPLRKTEYPVLYETWMEKFSDLNG